jgi:hypothetical protein
MSTTPPSDPWGTPADRPDQAEPEQPTPDEPADQVPDQPTPEQQVPDQPAPDAFAPDSSAPDQRAPEQPLSQGPPTAAEPTSDPWAAPPPGPTGESATTAGFDHPPGNYAPGPEPAAYPPPMPPQVPYGAAPPKPSPPSSVLTAVKLMYAGAALSALGLVISLLSLDSTRERLAEANPDFTDAELDAGVAFGVTLAAFIGVVGILLWVWMAETNRRGKSWARIVATVLGGINILLTVISLTTGQSTGLVVVFNLISAALAAVILFLLYRPDSNAYYEAMSDLKR